MIRFLSETPSRRRFGDKCQVVFEQLKSLLISSLSSLGGDSSTRCCSSSWVSRLEGKSGKSFPGWAFSNSSAWRMASSLRAYLTALERVFARTQIKLLPKMNEAPKTWPSLYPGYPISTAVTFSFHNPDATPTPSSSNHPRDRRRRSSVTPNAAATPSSTDDVPPSSEAGEGDDDEAPPMYVWGTNISVQDVNAAILRFLRHFRENPQQIEGKYMRIINHVIETEGDSLDVDAHDVFDYDSDLYIKMVRYPLEVLAIFDIVLMDMVNRINPLFEKLIQARIFNLKSSTSLRNLNPSDVEKMVSVKGMIIRCSSIIPEIKEAVFRCLVCGYYSDPIVVDRGRIDEPTACVKQECLSKNSMTLVHNRCRFADKQVVRLQETPDEIPEGGTPHTVSLLMHDRLVDAGKPGDRVEVTGIYRAMSVRIGQTQRTVKSIFKASTSSSLMPFSTYIDCLHLKTIDKSRMYVEDSMVTENEASRNDNESTLDIEDKVEQLKELSRQPDIYERLTRSLAPNIWELDDVKKGLLCQGDINILLVGDPGTSKSQLLQYIHKLSPRGIYTSGRGSSAVGLTAYVTKDPETGETVLESGALVLSDRGICCIDEFDKMSENARSMLHEADEQTDRRLAKHIVALHFEDPDNSEQNVIDLPTLTAYVSYARKHIHPQLSDEAAEELTRGYVEMRRKGNFPGSSKKVEKRDVAEAFRLLEVAMQQSATDHSTGTIDMDLITTGVSASERMRRENLASTTRSIIMEKMQLGGPSIRLLELLEELKKQSPAAEIHLSDLRHALATLSGEGFVVVHGDSVKRV
ncbi:hypothetical protein DH2020_044792 [Rehmannia glutinosa]|uniref:DNA replication licensing factor MCM4 n=1 Tax=Rehmannia glutinosa TaxID=99300 RepID=A0ABR0UFY3_REHGL